MTEEFDIEEIVKPLGIEPVNKFLKREGVYYILSGDFIYKIHEFSEDSEDGNAGIEDILPMNEFSLYGRNRSAQRFDFRAIQALYSHWKDWKESDNKVIQQTNELSEEIQHYRNMKVEELVPHSETIQDLQNRIEDVRAEALDIKSSASQEVENIYTLIQSMSSTINISDSTVLVRNLENKLSVDEKLELLDDRLARGEISEELYHSIANRYQN